MIEAMRVSAANLALGLLAQINMSEKADGGGRKQRSKNAAYTQPTPDRKIRPKYWSLINSSKLTGYSWNFYYISSRERALDLPSA